MPLSRRTPVHCNCCDFFLLLSNFCHNRIFFPIDKHRNVILKATMPFIMRTTDVAAVAMHTYLYSPLEIWNEIMAEEYL